MTGLEEGVLQRHLDEYEVGVQSIIAVNLGVFSVMGSDHQTPPTALLWCCACGSLTSQSAILPHPFPTQNKAQISSGSPLTEPYLVLIFGGWGLYG